MPRRLAPPCTRPGCEHSKPCPEHSRQQDRQRGTAAERGYGHRWATDVRTEYIEHHPICCLCQARATDVPDHWPASRKDLVAAGVPDPDAWHRLRPLCDPCHRKETPANQPGGWYAEQQRRS